MAKKPLAPGDKAPSFKGETADGPISLKDLKDETFVLYFYPKDDTPGCTAEACSFRDQYTVFSDAGAEVVGISSDGVDDHRAFADKNHLPFRLLSDVGGRVRKSYGVKRTLGLIDGRVTFVIDRAGVVRHVFTSQLRPRQHVAEALQKIRELASA